jgi:hypothetical protein
MRAKATRTITVSSEEIESAIEALSSAGQALKLTRFQRASYHGLMVSIDVGAVTLVMAFMVGLFTGDPSDLIEIFIVCMFIGLVCLVLNIPLLLETIRERTRLKSLGLSSLSKILWIESRRSRWISRARGALLTVVGIITLVYSAVGIVRFFRGDLAGPNAVLGLFIIAIASCLLFGAQFLRNQRERMDLTASAEELRNALQSLRLHAGMRGFVSVPSELLEQAAKIETAQIAKERKDAVLQSVALRPTEYAIAYDRDAAEQRATLCTSDRVELEDLVAQLSTDGGQLGQQAQAVGEATLRGMTKSKRIEIEYVIDHASHRIRIAAVRHAGDGPRASLNGASYA